MKNKRLNRKGFTLIELLAVIVVLAIILVITVPMILNTIGDTRQQALADSTKSVADFYRSQFSLKSLGPNRGEENFMEDLYDDTGSIKANSGRCITDEESEILGLSSTDYLLGSSETETNCSTTGYQSVSCSCVAWTAKGKITVVLAGKTKGDGGQFEALKSVATK